MRLKKCSQCNQELPISDFYKWKYSKDGLRSECKACSKLNNKQYYDANKQQIIDNVARYTESHRDQVKQYQHEYAKNNSEILKNYYKERGMDKKRKVDTYKTPCAKCGESRLYVIDFHHIDPSTKSFTIGDLYRGNDKKIAAEVSKCVCLCSNCHREFHYLYGIVPQDPVNELEKYLGVKFTNNKVSTTTIQN